MNRSTSAFRLPAGIWALGLVSLCMDTSSELIHSLLPVFLSGVLGASMTTIGIIEGVAEATASITKIISGAISDRLGHRKWLAVMGYGLAALTKPVFPLATSVEWVFAARFVDRIGKGIRGAPRDALVADMVKPEMRGAAYGLRQALDSVGAFLGPLGAALFMLWFADNIRHVLWIAVVPGFLAVALLVFGVQEPAPPGPGAREGRPGIFKGVGGLPRSYWMVVGLGAVFTLARFSEAFLVLRARDTGLHLALVPLVLIIMNAVYMSTAYPAGAAADRIGARRLLEGGLATLLAADLVLACASSPGTALAGAALWGLHMGLTQGLFAKLVADSVPSSLRGTGFGIFNLVSGIALLLASVIAGWTWSTFGAAVTFLVGGAFAALAALGLAASGTLHPRGA